MNKPRCVSRKPKRLNKWQRMQVEIAELELEVDKWLAVRSQRDYEMWDVLRKREVPRGYIV